MPLHSLCTLPDDLLLDGIFRHLEPRQLVRLRLVRRPLLLILPKAYRSLDMYPTLRLNPPSFSMAPRSREAQA